MQLRFSGRLNFTQAMPSFDGDRRRYLLRRVRSSLVSSHKRNQIGKWPGWVSIVIQRVSVKLSIPCLAAEPAIARRAHPAERHLRFVVHGRAVDVADAGLDLPRNAQPRAVSRVKTAADRPYSCRWPVRTASASSRARIMATTGRSFRRGRGSSRRHAIDDGRRHQHESALPPAITVAPLATRHRSGC
jgi:hypothetical protein